MDKQGKRKIWEVVNYFITGVLVVLVELAAFWALERIMRPLMGERSYLVSQIAAWVVAVIFAFFANKIFVFRSKSWEARSVMREASTFFTARLISFVMNYVLMLFFMELIWKLLSAWFTQLWEITLGLPFAAYDVYLYGIKFGFVGVLVLVANYFASKFIIFKSAEPQRKEEMEDGVSTGAEERIAEGGADV